MASHMASNAKPEATACRKKSIDTDCKLLQYEINTNLPRSLPMPVLANPRHEAFAQARAKGALLDDAYEDAGFAPGNGHASRLAKTEAVAERIAELKALESDMADAAPHGVIAALLALARDKEVAPAAAKEARLALMEASRLRGQMQVARTNERIYHLRSEIQYKQLLA
jgi:hypothetical protein